MKKTKVVAVSVDTAIEMMPRVDIGDADILTYWVKDQEAYYVFRKAKANCDIVRDNRTYSDFADLAGEVLLGEVW